ncbi:hypothetical protein AVEN_38762-1 [Araneus ventricosus]|uniref:Uncharacterized protein n=1 Tax=Araneus ventricosus TaxID=182803 RepID=A0A4Y2NG78_ARAVE|nr:hypothetical protein AVEN_38762-1 [Araneus ventricosus]
MQIPRGYELKWSTSHYASWCGYIMVWDVFTWYGPSSLVKLNQKLIENGYVQPLGDHLPPFMDFMYPNNDGIFHDDNEA